MAKKASTYPPAKTGRAGVLKDEALPAGRASALLDTRVVYCGDNLEQLRKLPDRCVDLIYIDPPFNSNRNYEVFWGETKEKRAFEDRHASTQAYIEFMRPRCVELARVLKPTGSFYYHCDWHASHYVKVMLDQIFGENNFVNEVVWKRQTSHNDAKQGSKHYGRLHDVLLFYCGGNEDYTWNQQYVPLDDSYIESHYSQVDDKGRRFQWGDLRAPGGAAPSKGNPHYKVLGVDGYWRYTQEKIADSDAVGHLFQSCRTPFRGCRTVIGAKRRSGGSHKEVSDRSQVSPGAFWLSRSPSEGRRSGQQPCPFSRRLFGRAVSGGNGLSNSSSRSRRSPRVTDSLARPNRRGWG
jgi:hypothetical protein